ncbi:MAG: hypothetical protein ACRYF8_02310, partial [Janthinobacterium lividum]
RGPAPNGHPCPDGALAASMRLDPLRVVCVRPAPKSRLVLSGLFVLKIKSRSEADQKQIKGFPAEAGPTDCAFVRLWLFPLNALLLLVGPALAGKASVGTLRNRRSAL